MKNNELLNLIVEQRKIKTTLENLQKYHTISILDQNDIISLKGCQKILKFKTD